MTQVKNPGRAEEEEEAISSYSPKSLIPSKLTPMDIKSTRYLQATSMFASTKDSPPLERNSSFYCKSKEIPFADAFPDPLCKLNLKETSEFVKAFPMPSSNNSIESRNCFLETSSVQARKEELISTLTQKRLEAPPTPGRPVFSFSAGNFSRKSYPSKWDDAEKWVISSSCHESPAHLVKPPETSSSISRHGDLFLQKGETFAEKSKIIEENVLKSIRNYHGSFPPGHTHTVSTEVLLKDKFTDNVEPILPNLRYSEPTKEGFLFRNSACETMKDAATEVVPQVHHRDIGTEMTPLGSSTTSRCHTPLKSSSPARHNTPANRSGPLETPINSSSTINISELQECHLAKLELGTQFDSVVSNWSSREEEEEEVSKSLRHFETGSGECSKNVAADSRASAWEEEERTKSCIRYQREEAKIQAWVNLQSAKAEAESRKLEVKIQKMRSNLEEKLMKRMAIVHRKAEEWRATAQQQHSHQVQKAAGHAQKMKNQHNKSCLPDPTSCGCFPCSNHSL